MPPATAAAVQAKLHKPPLRVFLMSAYAAKSAEGSLKNRAAYKDGLPLP